MLKHIGKHGVRFSAYLLAFFLLKGSWWLAIKLGSPTIDQIIFHLQNANDGLADTDPQIFRSVIVHLVEFPILFAVILFGIQQAVLSNKAACFIERHSLASASNPFLKASALVIQKLQTAFNNYIPFALVVFSAFVLANKVGLLSHLQSLQESEFFQEHYIEPQTLAPPKKKRNLVLIYIESLENGFSEPKVMGRDLLNSLERATEKDYRFNNFQQTTGTGWTIAAIVSTQCGIPLKSTTLFDGNTQGERLKSFLPNAKCLGDLLHAQGYKNVFLGGASLYFAGKGKFLSQHGYTELRGREEWSTLGETAFNGWGLYDDRLLENAKLKLDELEKSKQPFNLTLLTVDTHFPDGFYSPTCARRGVTDYKGIVSCTSDLVTDFLKNMKQKGYLKNTVVVILGDHLAMQVPVYDDLERAGHRTIFNRFITPDSLEKNRDDIYHFSIFPTILYSLGFRFDKNRLGLGASGFGSIDEGYELQKIPRSAFDEALARSSEKYTELWESNQEAGTLDKN